MNSRLLFEASRFESKIPLETVHRIFLALALLTFLLFSASVYKESRILFGITLIVLSPTLVALLWMRFLRFFWRLKPAPLPPDASRITDPFSHVDFEMAKLFASVPDFFPETLIIALFDLPFGVFFLSRLGYKKTDIVPRLTASVHQPSDIGTMNSAEAVIRAASSMSLKRGHDTLDMGNVFMTLALLSPEFKNFLNEEKIEIKDLDHLSHWYSLSREHAARKGITWSLKNSPPIGTDWAYAYTPLLDKYSEAVKTGVSEEEHLHFLGHNKEILLLIESLLKKSESNAILVGEPGVGKHTIVQGVARMIGRGQAGPLSFMRVVKLNLELVFGQKSFGDTTGLLTSVLREAEYAGNIILVIDDIHNYLTPLSKTNISEILVPILKSTATKVIGMTDSYGYQRSALENQVIMNLFEKIDVLEPDEKRIFEILTDVASHKERRHNLFITYPAIHKIFELSDQYLTTSPFPEKAINFLEDTCVFVETLGEKTVTAEYAEKVLERKIGLPVGNIEKEEKGKLLSLENELHKRIIDQEEGIAVLSDAMRRSRSGLGSREKPIGSFLFLGPTGVGKTETAKALSEFYFGDEERMIRFDMSEYQKRSDVYRLIGNPDSREPGQMATKVRENPFSLLLLDEIEKAHRDILNLFLRVLDEGKFTDAFGKRVDFRNTIIIGTSNAGAEFIRQSLVSGVPYEELKKNLVDSLLRDGLFKPEFINRFDAVVIFKPLSKTELVMIARLMLTSLGKRIEKQGFRFELSEETLDGLAEATEKSVFGARELRRIIQDTIESPLAKDLLEGRYEKGETIRI